MSSIDDAYFVGRSIFIHNTPKDGENQKHSNYCQFLEMFQWWGFLQSSLEYIYKKDFQENCGHVTTAAKGPLLHLCSKFAEGELPFC